MIGKALDSNNDLIIQDGRFLTVEDGAETLQHVRTRLQFFLGEWFLDRFAGVPWLQEIFTKPVNLANVESRLKSTILDTPTVEELVEFSLSYEGGNSRELSVSFSANTIFGEIIEDEVTINV